MKIEPTNTPRGSNARIEVYRQRKSAGLPMHHPDDGMDIIPRTDNGPVTPSIRSGCKRCRCGISIPVE